jgi:SAM-dependent methyltransferase
VAAAELDPATALWLVGEEGLASVAVACADLADGADALALGTRLRRDGLDAGRAAAVVAAAAARRRASGRWPDADRLLFTREGLEQASDPRVSTWRARRFGDTGSVEDRAAGCGGDTLALAEAGPHVTAIDTDAARLTLLRHNAAVRGLEVDTIVADALLHPPPTAAAVHADPGRRVGGRRVRALADHRPSVPALIDHLAEVVRGPGVGIVLGPGVDLDDPGLPSDAELEFVQVGGDLVEAVLWCGGRRTAGAHATATLLDRNGEPGDPPVAARSRGARAPRLPVGPVGEVLVEVAPAAVRARLHDELGAEVGARRLASRRALLTADEPVGASPWWRARPVEAVVPARATALRRHLRSVDELPLELALHGLEVDLRRLRRQLGDPPGGPSGRRVDLVRTDDGAVAVVTLPPG